MAKRDTGYYSDNIIELTFSITTKILSVKDGWRLAIVHNEGEDLELSSSTIYLEKTVKKKSPIRVFEIFYEMDNEEPPTASFIAKDWKGYTGEQLAAVTKADIDNLIAESIDILGDIGDANWIIYCQAIPDEIRQWIIMNGVNDLGPELKKARSEIKRLVKPVFKTALANKLARKV